ncbi:MAG: disulfide bond formation protein B [Rhodospirillales bacterium 20-60-12]|nr:MAG: disulfide bond formation protein B [Rhodospirillales bacterium 20-60-12]OYV62766.1 MAG: disulfide bond formation protein B [Acidiphilium sp. 21-62-4]HQT65979.1 disulfide bond formation protein B [Acetobacteraceae bacterium]HQU01221.1 disulfide bond formation protein B [Acetobacteraceae bacterium]
MKNPSHRSAGVIAAGLALAALAVAYFAEFHLMLVPCPLCLLERWPYRVVIALGLVACLVPRVPARWALWLAAVALLGDAAIAFVHIGVEYRWWVSPLPECNIAPPSFGAMPLHPAKPCDDPTFLIPGLKLSMAFMNMLFALSFAAGLSAYLWSSRSTAA